MAQTSGVDDAEEGAADDKCFLDGVAGGAGDGTDDGAVVVAYDGAAVDFDLSLAAGDAPLFNDLGAISGDPASGTLRALAVSAAHAAAPEIRVFEGRVCSGDQFIASREQKETILANFGGECCEMEGGAIAQACYLNSTPFVIIRAISDKNDALTAIFFSISLSLRLNFIERIYNPADDDIILSVR